jgi:uncharacterized repeat protein (TIGR03803 family)
MVRIYIAALACFFGAGITGAALAQAGAYRQVYAFPGGTGNGADPLGGLIAVGGLIYGTTCGGGPDMGLGTVFSLKPKSGGEKIVHYFGKMTGDGACPRAGLIDVGGVLFGTTFSGGAHNDGTVFSLTPGKGAEKIVYSFQSGSDGANPQGDLLNVSGTLYGTTQSGGSAACGGGCGTVFSVDAKTGAEKSLYAFGGGTDGIGPLAGLIDWDGKLYGTTELGGAAGYGTVFSIDEKTGKEKIVYNFLGGDDGAYPHGSLVRIGSTLYGTTDQGGKTYELGTVFAVTPKTGAEKIIYAFQGGTKDGAYPDGSLTNVGGVLFGMTTGGGAGTCTFACGIVFSVDPATLTEQAVYFFQGNSDGGKPFAGVLKMGKTLYGTTSAGGDGTNCSPGCGTVFALKP